MSTGDLGTSEQALGCDMSKQLFDRLQKKRVPVDIQTLESLDFESGLRLASKLAELKMAPEPGVQTFVRYDSSHGTPPSSDLKNNTTQAPGSATPGGAGREIGQFSYNGPDSGSDIKPRTLGIPGEQYGHPSNDTYNTVTRRTMTSSRAGLFWEDEWEEFDGDPWEVADSAGINILRGKDFRAGLQYDGEIVAVLFDESDRDGYSFDIAVSPDHRRKGYAKKLLELALDIYEENREVYGDDYTLNLDVVSPIMEKLLKSKGFKEVGRDRGHTFMTREASPSSVLRRIAKEAQLNILSGEYPEWYFVARSSLTSTPDYGEHSNAAVPRGDLETSQEETNISRVAGDVMLYDQHNPSNNEITQPGENVDYRAEGPTTFVLSPDDKSGLAPSFAPPDNQTDNVPPASSRVVPTSMKTAALLAEILSNCGPEIVGKSGSVSYKRTRILPDRALVTYEVSGSKGEKYKVYIKGARKGNVKALAKMQLQVSCSCNFFRWSGPEHWAKTNRFLYGKPVGTASKPVVRDPKGQHWACKHVYAILNKHRNTKFASSAPDIVPMGAEGLREILSPEVTPSMASRVALSHILKGL